MKEDRRNNISILIGMTIITVIGLFSMMPSVLPSQLELGDLSTVYVGGKNLEDWSLHNFEIPEEEASPYVINDEVLDKFIEVYTMDSLENRKQLTTQDKEEIRLILEDMGNYNTTKLKEVLETAEESQVAQEVHVVLEENLFDWDMYRLDLILGVESEEIKTKNRN